MSLQLIRDRRVLYPGVGDVPDYRDGTKVTFHFRTVKVAADCPLDDEVVIDDTRTGGRPMELIIGKKFKLTIWEEWIKSMRVREVSRLVADWRVCVDYPFVSKCYRQYARRAANGSATVDEEPPARHCCGMAVNTGLGHSDLDDLVANPSSLQFTIELVSVESPEDYDKEVWQLTGDEMVDAIPNLRRDGNRLYADGKYGEAGERYGKALAIIEQLLLREKPGDDDWLRLDTMKIPLLANLSQCRLLTDEYYPAIEMATECLARDPDNTKALFRRAKAHSRVWNLSEARQDLQRVQSLDPTLATAVRKELLALDELVKSCDQKDRQLLKGKLFS